MRTKIVTAYLIMVLYLPIIFGAGAGTETAPYLCKSYYTAGVRAAEICYYSNISYSSSAHQVKCAGAGAVTLNTYLKGFYWKNGGAKCVDYTWDSVDVGSGWADLWYKNIFGVTYKVWSPSISCLRYGSDGHYWCN
jgi:hypothetical protein